MSVRRQKMPSPRGEGVGQRPTDEVEIQSVRSRTPQLFIIHYSLFIRRRSLRPTDEVKKIGSPA